LLDQRQAARQAQDWEKADALRRELEALGVAVRDEKRTTS
jgi:cysteinyl-tRNA synthetase